MELRSCVCIQNPPFNLWNAQWPDLAPSFGVFNLWHVRHMLHENFLQKKQLMGIGKQRQQQNKVLQVRMEWKSSSPLRQNPRQIYRSSILWCTRHTRLGITPNYPFVWHNRQLFDPAGEELPEVVQIWLLIVGQGELEHRRVKRFYLRVHKGKFTEGITKQQRRERILHMMKGQAPHHPSKLARKRKYRHNTQDATTDPCVSFNDLETLPSSSPYEHHKISNDVQHKIDLSCWLSEHCGDLATKVCNRLLV